MAYQTKGNAAKSASKKPDPYGGGGFNGPSSNIRKAMKNASKYKPSKRGQVGYGGGSDSEESDNPFEGLGNEGYGSDGGGDAYDPQPLIDQINAAREAAQLEVGNIDTAWRARLGGIGADQSKVNADTLRYITEDNTAQRQNYDAAINPIVNDLQAQGFTAAPIQQQAAMDQQSLAGYGQRQTDLARRFAEINDRSFSDRNAIASNTISGTRAAIEANAAAQIGDAYSGGGGGGGRGGSGSSKGDTLTEGAIDDLVNSSMDAPDRGREILANLGKTNPGLAAKPGVQRFILRNGEDAMFKIQKFANKVRMNGGSASKAIHLQRALPKALAPVLGKQTTARQKQEQAKRSVVVRRSNAR